MTDQPTPDTSSQRIDVPVTSLIEAVRFIDAFAMIFTTRIDDPDEYKYALRELWPEIVDGVNERCNEGVSVSNPSQFVAEARKYADELSIELRDHLDRAGVSITDYVNVTRGLID